MPFGRGLPGIVACCLLLLCGAFGADAGQAAAPSDPQANPARPTVSTPATLTPLGYLQFENGGLYAQDSPEFSSRVSFQQVTKLTVHPRLELILQSEPLVDSRLAGRSQVQIGGVAAGAQAVLLSGRKSRPTVAVSYLRSIYSGPAPDIDIGSASQSALVLISDDLWGFHADLNGIVNEQRKDAVRRAQWGQTLSISRSIEKFTIGGEIWTFSQPLVSGNTLGSLWALSYAAKKNLVFDVAFDHGFKSTSTRLEVFFGFTYVLPRRLWGTRGPGGQDPGYRVREKGRAAASLVSQPQR